MRYAKQVYCRKLLNSFVYNWQAHTNEMNKIYLILNATKMVHFEKNKSDII